MVGSMDCGDMLIEDTPLLPGFDVHLPEVLHLELVVPSNQHDCLPVRTPAGMVQIRGDVAELFGVEVVDIDFDYSRRIVQCSVDDHDPVAGRTEAGIL